MGRNVKWNKKLAFDWPNQGRALEKLGNKAAAFLYDRINEEGVDADGRPLPEVSDREWVKRTKRGRTSKPFPSYMTVKTSEGGQPWKGSSFTGAMWDSLTIRQQGTAGKLKLKLYFAGSTSSSNKKKWNPARTKLVDKNPRIRNRDKARLLQYADRASGEGYQPKGKRQFELMAFSSGEKLMLAAYWLSQCRLLKPA